MASSTNILAMRFRTADDKTRVVNVQPCKMNVTDTAVKALMDAMISSDAFVYQPAVKLGATIVQRMTLELF